MPKERMKMETVLFEAAGSEAGKRLDSAVSSYLVAEHPDDAELYSRSFVQKLIEDGAVSLKGKKLAKSYKVQEGDIIEIILPDPVPCDAVPQDIPVEIVYEDDDLLVVNKPKGMVVHPAVGNPDRTLVNALLYHCRGQLSGVNGVERPGIVHRIDKDTSGLLVVAKNDKAHLSLSEQIAAHTVTRRYYAVIYGHLKEKEGTIDAPIGRSKTDRKKYCVTEQNSRNAVTHYKVLEEFSGFSFLELRLETGRTHQIRVHMAYLGHPLAGDPVYGPGKVITELEGQCLHAGILGFVHPSTGEYMEFSQPLPEYFTAFLDKLRRMQ